MVPVIAAGRHTPLYVPCVVGHKVCVENLWVLSLALKTLLRSLQAEPSHDMPELVGPDFLQSVVHLAGMGTRFSREWLLRDLEVGWHIRIQGLFLCLGELVQERRNSSALAMELCLSCTNPSIWWLEWFAKELLESVFLWIIKSLAPGKCDSNFGRIIFKFIVQNCSLGTHCQIALRWVPQNLTNDKLT